MTDTYDELLARWAQTTDLGAIRGLLYWDQETCMPPGGATRRAEQHAAISRVIHERATDPAIGDLLATAEAAPAGDDDRQVNLREIRRAYDRQTRLPADLVTAMARVTAQSQEHWKAARAEDDFAQFAPWLEQVIGLKREYAACLDAEAPAYDVLLDEYERGMTAEALAPMFAQLREHAVGLLGRITASGPPRRDFLDTRTYPQAAQAAFSHAIVPDLGFDMQRGRIDVAVHPFCSGLSVGDVRLTTRYDETDPSGALFGLIHEAGHGLYEQGLPPADAQPLCQAASMGVHESQSRLWENFIGRGRPFWDHYWPALERAFPAALEGVSLQEWHRAINHVRPSLIRVEADELTYNLHIILRLELELALIGGDLAVADLPAAWNEGMARTVGLTPPDDASGVLQDIHWSGGGFGYFPTYTLGNLYAAQLWDALRGDLAEVDAAIAAGDFAPILGWLRKRIHAQGCRWPAPELIERASGSAPSPRPLIDYLEDKYTRLYGLS